MSFGGRNPMVPKAQIAEQKARDASDDNARTNAWREAARLWERAGERETDNKRRAEYERNAEAARAQADGGEAQAETEEAPAAPVKPPANVGRPN